MIQRIPFFVEDVRRLILFLENSISEFSKLSPQNKSETSLHRRVTEYLKTASSSLIDAYQLLNDAAACSDDGDLEDTRLLKQLTGEDMITADRKYLNPIQFKNHAKMIFLTNQIPRTHDTTDGFYRRAYLVEFPRQFEENPLFLQRVNDLESVQSQYEGLLYEATKHLRNLKMKKFIFSRHRSPNAMKKEYESLSNPLSQFVETFCEKSVDGIIPKKIFRERFVNWLRERGFNLYSETRLGSEMKELGYEEGKRQCAGTRNWCWLGIRWRP